MRVIGSYENVAGKECFIPYSLPPQNPPLTLDAKTTDLYGEAMHQLGRLNGIAHGLPDVNRFIKAYIIKEALLSSLIEGIHTSLVEVFTQPLLESKPNKNTQLVINYTAALSQAISMIKKDGLPIASRVILKAHEVLLQGGEGDKSDPGHYRKQMVKVGNLIPAPPLEITKLMADLERFINTYEAMPMLIKAGLAHVQFETIHPFLDGNGRIGRLLIILMLIEKGVLIEPILYPSYYFKKYNLEYYHRLDRVRTHGDFEGWIQFYLMAIKDSCIDAYWRTQDIQKLGKQLIENLSKDGLLSDRKKEAILQALTILFSNPIINVNEMSLQLDVSYNTANQIILELIKVGILVEENHQKKRGKLFKFKQYLDVLEQEYT